MLEAFEAFLSQAAVAAGGGVTGVIKLSNMIKGNDDLPDAVLLIDLDHESPSFLICCLDDITENCFIYKRSITYDFMCNQVCEHRILYVFCRK